MSSKYYTTITKGKFILSALSGGLFFTLCFYVMKFGHLHEDAYILYQYSRSVSNGLGISFDVVNGPAEGATDFLWMTALGLAHRIFRGYVPIGVIAALLNSLGIAYVASQILSTRRSVDLNGCALCLLLLFSGGASASVGGFGTVAYGSVYVATILAFWANKFTRGIVFAMLLALFRPDGFFLGLATIISYLTLHKNELNLWRESRKLLLLYVAPLVLYFTWRYSYFGLLLPLPLLVKQRTDYLLEGLLPNLGSLGIYISIIAGIFLFRNNLDRRLTVLSLSGSLTLYALLLFAHQSQNVGYRFQFPLHLAIILLAASAFPSKKKITRISLFLITFAASASFLSFGVRSVTYLTNDDYINSFPQILSQRMPLDSIAITEAGRFPYWYTKKSSLDLVGLNSKRVVLNGPLAELKRVAPDLVFIHHSGRFIFPESLRGEGKDNYFTFDPRLVKIKEYQGMHPVALAPAAALEDAISRSLVGVAVKYGEGDIEYRHVYFLSKTVDMSEFLQALSESFKGKISYLSSEKLSKRYQEVN